jgi:mRNA-degrading endonuclease RelE of RelBE toxin-antitoxin system
MFQIIFNELSAAEISALPKRLQLELLAEFKILPEDLEHLDSQRFGVIERAGRKLYRYRAKDYRTKASRSTGCYTRTRFAIFFSAANCQFLKTRNSARRMSSGSSSRKAREEGRHKAGNGHPQHPIPL